MKYDTIVLGAGIVGISTALHLQARGQSVALVDRRGPAEETSYGNAGIIQRESIARYAFPRDWSKVVKYAANRLPEANLHWQSLPWMARILFDYWRHSVPARMEHGVRAMWAVTNGCLVEHEQLLEQAGVSSLVRRTGYLKLYRRAEILDVALRIEQAAHDRFGVRYEQLGPSQLQELEPHIQGDFAGGILLPNHISVSDPGAVGKAYASLFEKRGGHFVKGDARALEKDRQGWQLRSSDFLLGAPDVVIALGPWSADLLARMGLRVPLGSKRGYHVHFQNAGNFKLSRPVVDAEFGYVLSEMSRGIRLTTGAEFALRDAPPTPVQLDRVEPVARKLFPLAGRIEQQPWLGVRPFFPDLLPMIGQVPGQKGLWTNFGHHHLGFTTGPTTGRLLAEMITNAATFTDPAPYRPDRFS